MHKTMQSCMDTLHATQREANLTMTFLLDIPTFNGQDSSKLEDWLMDIETATDILTESHTHLAETKSCSLTLMLICEALQVGRCWDKIKGTLRFKLCKANIDIKCHASWRYNGRIMKPLLPMCTTSKQQLSNGPLTMTLWPSTFLSKDFGMCTPPEL